MVENISKAIKYWKEFVFVITVIVGYISSNPLKEWLTKDIKEQLSILEEQVNIANKVACGNLSIQILQTQMNSILAIDNQNNVEAEKQRQLALLKIVADEYKKTSKLCENA